MCASLSSQAVSKMQTETTQTQTETTDTVNVAGVPPMKRQPFRDYHQIYNQIRQWKLIFKTHNQNISNFESRQLHDLDAAESFWLAKLRRHKQNLVRQVTNAWHEHREQMGGVTAKFWGLRQQMGLYLDEIHRLQQLPAGPDVEHQMHKVYTAAATYFHDHNGELTTNFSELLDEQLSRAQVVCDGHQLSSDMCSLFTLAQLPPVPQDYATTYSSYNSVSGRGPSSARKHKRNRDVRGGSQRRKKTKSRPQGDVAGSGNKEKSIATAMIRNKIGDRRNQKSRREQPMNTASTTKQRWQAKSTMATDYDNDDYKR